MAGGSGLTRRSLMAGFGLGIAGDLLSPATASAQATDLRGLDALWRSADDAIRMFFGPVEFSSEGLDVDLPQHADVGSSVPLTIRIHAGMTETDYPRVVHVLAHGNPTPHVLSAWFRPGSGRAEFSTRIRLEKSQTVTAVAEMSDGRHIRVDREISVSFGACAQIGTGGNDDVFSFKPQTKVNVQPTAQRGGVIPVRALISHPMETGLRFDGLEEWIKKRIISSFECSYNGDVIFRTRLYPAVATNPYFLFYARVKESGTFDFTWYDMIDLTFKAQAHITVA